MIYFFKTHHPHIVKQSDYIGLQAAVFCLVAAAFTTIYIPQPVLPVLQTEFKVDEKTASLAISVLIFGMALSNMFFGKMADRYPIKPIIVTGGIAVTACGIFSAFSASLIALIAIRFIQGLFIPSLTTCLAAYLAKRLPLEKLNVVMGSYVSATVAGGLFGRLLGGWISPVYNWRFAFLSAAFFVLSAMLAAACIIPAGKTDDDEIKTDNVTFIDLITRKDLLRIYMVAFASYFAFSSVYNYMPFYLSSPPFKASTSLITMMYFSYITGIIIGPFAGKLSNIFGSGKTLVAGSLIFGLSIGFTLFGSISVIAISLIGVCAGFFTIHATAAGLLNCKLTCGKGRANSLYVFFYYMGGSIGITLSGIAYNLMNWQGIVALCMVMMIFPLIAGLMET